MRILMLAAENDCISGAKVGGVADVIRDVPKALAEHNVNVDVVIPDYGYYHSHYQGECVAEVSFSFAHQQHSAYLYKLHAISSEKVAQYVVVHPLFQQAGESRVYCHDEDNRPFAKDATKFALFCNVIAECILQGHLSADIFHLHDWHAATLAVLLKFDTRYRDFANTKLVYTVHNLALQGTRPFNGDDSSLEAWFPSLSYDGQQLCDPRYPFCYNPMRAAISLVDKVHFVSDSYAEEVLSASDHHNGVYGGEGLENVLAEHREKLVGILNGCEYNNDPEPKVTLDCFLRNSRNCLRNWMSRFEQLKTVHYLANEQITLWQDSPQFKGPIVSSIGRLTEQKVRLLLERVDGELVLSTLLLALEQKGGRFIMLGSGDSHYEFQLMQLMAKHGNFLFLNGYGQSLSDDLYLLGDMFLMPSSFEPCGISQMLALKAGQPCIVHGVGGLKDTVKHNENGFVFEGDTIAEQVRSLQSTFNNALDRFMTDQPNWQTIISTAKASRFSWQSSIEQYLSKLYNY